MKIVLSILLTCVFSPELFAQQPVLSFRRWDANKDGKLVREELPENVRNNFGRVDSNKDGSVSLEEHTTFLSRRNRAANNPPSRLKNVVVKRDMAYVENGHERHKLDLYLPLQADKKLPLVVWIHGGGWRQGSKDSGGPALDLVSHGFIVASINYRLSNHAIFPAQIHDCKAAIRWLRAHADEYKIDAEHIGVWGSSAGGHLVALLGTSGDVVELEGDLGHIDQSSRVQAVCDWFGPTDLLLMNKQSGDGGTMNHDAIGSPESLLLGGPLQQVPEKAKLASPLSYVTPDDPAFLIVHGDKDPLVAWQQSQLLADALKASKCDVLFTIVPGAGHGGFSDPQIKLDCMRFFVQSLMKDDQ